MLAWTHPITTLFLFSPIYQKNKNRSQKKISDPHGMGSTSCIILIIKNIYIKKNLYDIKIFSLEPNVLMTSECIISCISNKYIL